jgi:hypothetical protein
MSIDLVGLLSARVKSESDMIGEISRDVPVEVKQMPEFSEFRLDLSGNPYDVKELGSIVYRSDLWKKLGIPNAIWG